MLALLFGAMPAHSQAAPPTTAAYPEPLPPAGGSAAAAATPSEPSATPPAPQTVAISPAAAPSSVTLPPSVTPPPSANAPSAAAAPPTTYSAAAPQNSAGATVQPGGNYNAGRSGVAEPPAPPPSADQGFEFPDMSVRVDPLNWIIYGRLGLELEAAVWKFISVEVVPVFVTNEQPPLMNLGSLPATLRQESNGLGALSGASIGAGFWLNGEPFRGTVLRLIYTNYGYRYISRLDDGREMDNAVHTERHLVGFLGSHSKWGPFTIASGIGLGVELNRERRCRLGSTGVSFTKEGCSKDVFELQLTPSESTNLYGWLHPAYLTFRLSLGFVF